jgi:hypothetical protein
MFMPRSADSDGYRCRTRPQSAARTGIH